MSQPHEFQHVLDNLTKGKTHMPPSYIILCSFNFYQDAQYLDFSPHLMYFNVHFYPDNGRVLILTLIRQNGEIP